MARKYMTSAPLLNFLAFVANTARAFGYVTSKVARERGVYSTAWTAWVACDRERASLEGVMPEDVATARGALATVKETLDRKRAGGIDTLAEFERAVYDVIYSPTVTKQNLSVAAYIIPMAVRILADRERPAPTAAPSTSSFLGCAGERITVTGKVKDVRRVDSSFGVSYLLKVETAEGNLVTTFLRGQPDFGASATVTLRGTVKTHKEFRGVKETQVNRPAIIGVATPAEPAMGGATMTESGEPRASDTCRNCGAFVTVSNRSLCTECSEVMQDEVRAAERAAGWDPRP